MRRKPNVIIRMGAPHWDARVFVNGEEVHYNFRTMEKKDRSAFHRELMNAFRATRTV